MRGRIVTVETDEPVPVELDGEQPGTTPARFEVLPGTLRLRVPAPRRRRPTATDDAEPVVGRSSSSRTATSSPIRTDRCVTSRHGRASGWCSRTSVVVRRISTSSSSPETRPTTRPPRPTRRSATSSGTGSRGSGSSPATTTTEEPHTRVPTRVPATRRPDRISRRDRRLGRHRPRLAARRRDTRRARPEQFAWLRARLEGAAGSRHGAVPAPSTHPRREPVAGRDRPARCGGARRSPRCAPAGARRHLRPRPPGGVGHDRRRTRAHDPGGRPAVPSPYQRRSRSQQARRPTASSSSHRPAPGRRSSCTAPRRERPRSGALLGCLRRRCSR